MAFHWKFKSVWADTWWDADGLTSCVNVADLEELRPALNLLCSAIKENDTESHSKHFSEQLLNLTLTFLTKQLDEIFVHTEGEITHFEPYVVMCH